MERIQDLKVIAFDADDTLWVNEPYFQEIERKFCEMMEVYHPQHTVSRELLATEIANLEDYGFGIKSFILSMIEAAIRISGRTIKLEVIEKIIYFGKEMLHKPIELLDGVEEVLATLNGRYRLVMATKGDLLDQERKLIKSGLEKHFHHIEILSDKKEANYQKLLHHLDIQPKQFLMVGNSLKSDVLPVLELGGYACHVPFHTTWEHEKIDYSIDHSNFRQLRKLLDLLDFI
ncbi:MAG: HAD family hydrolase [Saprospiraceae bacterium]|nr:HAD family hydrolase [Saprospiraceae bacterium]